MSKAKPMSDQVRQANYRTQRGQRPGHLCVPLTPRQARRVRHKQRKGKWGFGYPDTKGHATYPRAEAIRMRLAFRRNAEQRRPCRECNDTGLVDVDRCNCAVGPSGYYGMHERYCGTEPCPAGCWDRLHPEPEAVA